MGKSDWPAGRIAGPVGDAAQSRQLAGAVNHGVAGQDLLDQGAAGARHAQNEDRRGRGIAHVGQAPEELGIEHAGDLVVERSAGRLVVDDFFSLQRVSLEPLLEGTIVLADVLEGFAQGEMQAKRLAGGQTLAVGGQPLERGEIGVAGLKSFQGRAIAMRLDEVGIEGQRLIEARQGSIEPALVRQHFAQLMMRARVVGIEGQARW